MFIKPICKGRKSLADIFIKPLLSLNSNPLKYKSLKNHCTAFQKVETAGIVRSVRQKRYLKKLRTLEFNCDFAAFRSMGAAQIAWASSSRREICCPIALFTQVAKNSLSLAPQKFIKKINSIIRYLERNKGVVFLSPELDFQSLAPRVYSAASYATNHDTVRHCS